jgi:hypothetical protein
MTMRGIAAAMQRVEAVLGRRPENTDRGACSATRVSSCGRFQGEREKMEFGLTGYNHRYWI